ncbi:calcium/sodium antiporter [Piscicoccus intestinalis]|uniref:calcium/sodium antiporter n=1 Tax=Piscicoccus intestinalis TaxID=746033 RepID=UPI00278C6A53|nr:calcium/sodium antiporter [Piscicoccus intestinalis]
MPALDLLDLVRIVGGLVLLVVGGELLVSGASSIARRLGMSTLVVGLTIVSVATSAPELAVSVDAVLQGQPDLAVGNIVGSNTANALLVVGLAALVAPLAVQRRLLRLDLPFMVFLGVAFLALSLDGHLSPIDGLILIACFVAHVVITVVVGRRDAATEAEQPGEASEPDEAGETDEDEPLPLPKAILWLVLGLAGLVVGANVLVTGAIGIATAFGVSGLVIGLTIVAVGTSLPEIVSSISAARRGDPGLVLGNVVGSNIANLGLVLGLPALLPAPGDAPAGIPVPGAVIALDAPLMLAAMAALLPVAFTGYVIARWEGAAFVVLYAAYVAYVVLAASEHDALEGFTLVMAGFVLPLLAVVAVGLVAFEFGVRRGRALADAKPGDHPGEAPRESRTRRTD